MRISTVSQSVTGIKNAGVPGPGQVLKHLLIGNSMKPFNHICVLFSEPLEASLRFLMLEVLNACYRL